MGKTISFAKGKGIIRHNNRDFLRTTLTVIEPQIISLMLNKIWRQPMMKFSDKLFKITTLNRNGQIEK